MSCHERFDLLRCRCRCDAVGTVHQPNRVDTVALEFFNSVFVDDGLLESRLKLPETLFSFLGIRDGACFFNADLQMAHERIHRWFFAHGACSQPCLMNPC